MSGIGSIVRTSFQAIRTRREYNDNPLRLPLLRPKASAMERKLHEIRYFLAGQLARRIYEKASPRLKQVWREEADAVLRKLQNGET